MRAALQELRRGALAMRRGLAVLDQAGAGGILDSALFRRGLDTAPVLQTFTEILGAILADVRPAAGKRGAPRNLAADWLVFRTADVLRRRGLPVSTYEDGIAAETLRLLWPLAFDRAYRGSGGEGYPLIMRHWLDRLGSA